jgi:hypothetical protein
MSGSATSAVSAMKPKRRRGRPQIVFVTGSRLLGGKGQTEPLVGGRPTAPPGETG